MAKYLSRYVRGGPIANTRIVAHNAGEVRFRYTDHRDGRYKVRRLAATRFLEQLLWHVPEPGQHTVRHLGLYAHASRAKREHCRSQIEANADMGEQTARQTWQDYLRVTGHAAATVCPHCGRALQRGLTIARPSRRRQNSLLRSCGDPPRARLCATTRSTGTAAATGPP